MLEKVQGYIIKIVNHNDNSKILTLYTNKLGKITVAANIPEKLSNGNMGIYDLGNAVNVVLYRKTEDEMYKISEISLLKQYTNIHFDYEKLCILNYILYAINQNFEENFGDLTFMNFLKLYMRFINETKTEIKKMIFLFDYYFMLINGQIEILPYLNELETTFLEELSTQIVLKKELFDFITPNLIKEMNKFKKNKFKFLDINKELFYN